MGTKTTLLTKHGQVSRIEGIATHVDTQEEFPFHRRLIAPYPGSDNGRRTTILLSIEVVSSKKVFHLFLYDDTQRFFQKKSAHCN